MKIIRTKQDAQEVLNNYFSNSDYQRIDLYPLGYVSKDTAKLKVSITRKGCREFWNGEFGSVGTDTEAERVSMLYEYRKCWNEWFKSTQSVNEFGDNGNVDIF